MWETKLIIKDEKEFEIFYMLKSKILLIFSNLFSLFVEICLIYFFTPYMFSVRLQRN